MEKIPDRVPSCGSLRRKGEVSLGSLFKMIAAIAEASGCVVVTANEKDFAGLKIVNPMRP